MKTVLSLFFYYCNMFLLVCSNRFAFQQIKNFKSIPIIIISFNQLFYLQKLVSFLTSNGSKNIVIVDNNSTYKPLLSYFETIKNEVQIHKLQDNVGHQVFWKNKTIFEE